MAQGISPEFKPPAMQKKSVALIIILSGLIGYYTMLLSAQ
jgi:hypothetical protein